MAGGGQATAAAARRRRPADRDAAQPAGQRGALFARGQHRALRFGADRLEVENAGAPLPARLLARLGERFHRVDGQAESGSGLGVSIVQRIAALHGLALRYGARADGRGVVAALRPPQTAAARAGRPRRSLIGAIGVVARRDGRGWRSGLAQRVALPRALRCSITRAAVLSAAIPMAFCDNCSTSGCKASGLTSCTKSVRSRTCSLE